MVGVVLFHFGAEWLPGGFVGVDVFFVISGYVISKSLYRDIESYQFSILSFYERRARRILPAFFVVTLASGIVAYFLLLPSDLVSFAKSALASSFLSSNIFFYLTSDYFSPAAIEIPLLHYWSLGVEEQFYIFFPLIAMLTYRARNHAMPFVVIGLMIASLIACEIARRYDPTMAFYLLPFRAFELLIGCALALPQMRFPPAGKSSATIVAGGVVVIVACMLFVRETMPFPGILALAPCLGTAMVVWGADRAPNTASHLLSLAPMRFLGDISYSLYLVHWPIAVFWMAAAPDTPSSVFLIGGTLICITLAWLVRLLIERPFLPSQVSLTRTVVFSSSVTALGSLMLGAFAVIKFDGMPSRINPEIEHILAYQRMDYRDLFQRRTCFLDPNQRPQDVDLNACLPKGRPGYILWGDSSIAHYQWGLRPILTRLGASLGQLTASMCPPIVGLENKQRPNCKDFNDAALAKIRAVKPDTVILGAYWPITAPDSLNMQMLDSTVASLEKNGIRVVVLGPPIAYKHAVPVILAKRRMAGDQNAQSRESEMLLDVSKKRDTILKDHFSQQNSVTYISMRELFCQPQCPLLVDGTPIYFDYMHLTKAGSNMYATKLAPAIIRSN
ncbi:Peptidoglycan/LPS O-acetylase OafA/YrhL, contains acyltransferase and SGNH-hydrolase domains [Mesorhizobium sp. YR577]|nr:Peptidoglycan/LPS O-acetylase OafA/YrhL, contains acyltransferase and SGNH-hydrolase domains [Mesorhizobium sp. YR577]